MVKDSRLHQKEQESDPGAKGAEEHADQHLEVTHVAAKPPPTDAAAKDAAMVVEMRHTALAYAAVVHLTRIVRPPDEAPHAKRAPIVAANVGPDGREVLTGE